MPIHPDPQPESLSYPKKRNDVNARSVDLELVVLDRQNGSIHQLNQTASFVWEQCDGESTLEEIAKRMTEAFEIDFSPAISDVRKVIQQLNDIGLLEATTA
jgi:Coenzyme PQQ synthesis protein D (PqqD)